MNLGLRELGESGIKMSFVFFIFFRYSKNEYTEAYAGVPHNFIVVCTHFCFTAWVVLRVEFVAGLPWFG